MNVKIMSDAEIHFTKFIQAQRPPMLSLVTHTSPFLLQPTFKSTITGKNLLRRV